MDGERNDLEASGSAGVEQRGSYDENALHEIKAKEMKSLTTTKQRTFAEKTPEESSHTADPEKASGEQDITYDRSAPESLVLKTFFSSEPLGEDYMPEVLSLEDGKIFTVVGDTPVSVVRDRYGRGTEEQTCGDLFGTETIHMEGTTQSANKEKNDMEEENSPGLRPSYDLPTIIVHDTAEDIMIDTSGAVGIAKGKTTDHEEHFASSAPYINDTTQPSYEHFIYEHSANGDPTHDDSSRVEPLSQHEPTRASSNEYDGMVECEEMADAHRRNELPPAVSVQQESEASSPPKNNTAEEGEKVTTDPYVEEITSEMYPKSSKDQPTRSMKRLDMQPNLRSPDETMAKVAEKQVGEVMVEKSYTTQAAPVKPAHADERVYTASCEAESLKEPVPEVVEQKLYELVNGATVNAGHVNGEDMNGDNVNAGDVNGSVTGGEDRNGSNVSEKAISGEEINGGDMKGDDVNGVDASGRDMHGDKMNGEDVNGGDVSGGDVNGSDMNGGTINVGAAEASLPVEGHDKGEEVSIPASPDIKQQGAGDHQESVKQMECALNTPEAQSQRAKKGEKKRQQKNESPEQSGQTEQQNSRISTASKDKHPATDALPLTSTASTTIDEQSINTITEGNMDSVARRGVHSARSRGRGRGHPESRPANPTLYEVIPNNRRHKGFQPQEVLAKSKQLQENASMDLVIKAQPAVTAQLDKLAPSSNSSQQTTTVEPDSDAGVDIPEPGTPVSAIAPVGTPPQSETSGNKQTVPIQSSLMTASVQGSRFEWESNVLQAPLPDTTAMMAKYNLKPEPRIDFNKIPKYNFKQYSPTSPPSLANARGLPKSNDEVAKPSAPKVSFNTGAMDPPPKHVIANPSSATSGRADPNYIPPHLRMPMTNRQNSTSTSYTTTNNSSPSHANTTSNPKPGKGVGDVLITQSKEKRQSPWKVDPPSTHDTPLQQDLSAESSCSIDSNVPMGSESMPKKRQTLNYEERLAGWDGKWAPPPIDWEFRPIYDNNSKKKVKAVEMWAQGRADDAINNPIAIDTKQHGFRSGAEPASGLEDLDTPIASIVHDTFPPDDPQTMQQRDITVNDIVNKKLDEEKMKKDEAKEIRKAYRDHNRQIDRELKDKPVFNPRAPKADIYIRPATKLDFPAITEIYNYYINTSVVTPELVDLNQVQWLSRWEDVENEGLPFFVAVLRNPKGTHINGRGRHQPEPVVGFSYAEEYGNMKSAFKYTCEIQFFVRNNFLKQGIGKTLVDRMIGSMDPGYNSWMATDFLAEDRLRYELGGKRLIRSIIIQLPYGANDDTGLQWKKAWLDKEWEFKHAGTWPGIAIKMGKKVNIALFVKDTATTVEELRRPT